MEHASRKIVTRSPTRTVYILNLHGILPEPVECESNLERDFVLRASLHPLVSRITHQPFRLDLGNGHKYTPDFLISLAGTPCWVVEVKIKRKVSAYTETFRLAATQLRAHELGFLVATECEIQADRIHERAAHLLRYLKATCDKDECERVMRCAAEYPRGIPLSALTGLASVSP
ncbi:hypothetical protein, partial [Thiomonas sp.]|uniref:hypothetical protein n=1 Tax=Thiomonas sp. TaxID=2047785 RepID=UPI00258C874D